MRLSVKKGEFGYLKSRRYKSALLCLALFAFTLLLVLLSRRFEQHSKIFTICAVISVLPAAMSAVQCIMYMKSGGTKREVFESTQKIRGSVPVLYDCTLTDSDASWQVDAIAAYNGRLVCLISYKADNQKLERYLDYMAKKNALKGWKIAVFSERQKFEAALSDMAKRDESDMSSAERMCDLIRAISL